MIFFKDIKKAKFISRPNRFVVYCRLNGEKVRAYLPNPGRLHELFFKGVTLYLEKDCKASRTTEYTVIAVERDSVPVMLHTHRTNDIVEYLLKKGLVPGFNGITSMNREVKCGKSRFDFLIKKNGKSIFLEVKSCTLTSKSVAMFPDAVTARGKRHLEELATLPNKRQKGAVLFLVNSPSAKIFLPDYHTDPDFAEILHNVRNNISVIPLAVSWNKKMEIDESKLRRLKIPWKTLEREFNDSGCYFIILKLPGDKSIEIGSLGNIRFKKGFYIYAGSAKKNLLTRLKRHKRTDKKLFWHIDYLREEAEFVTALPIRTSDDIECSLAKEMKKVAEEEIAGFGCSDCKCTSHLFRMNENPLSERKFMKMLIFYRLERIIKMR